VKSLGSHEENMVCNYAKRKYQLMKIWALPTMRAKLIKIKAKTLSYACYIRLQTAEALVWKLC
jgi:hypothetical protein